MKQALTIFVSLLISLPALANDSIQLKFGYKANSTFVVKMETESDAEMSFEGNKNNLPEKLRDRFTTKILGKSILEESINTGVKSSDSSYSLEMFVQKHRKFLSLNESEIIESPATSGKLEGVTLQGKILSDGRVQFISAHGGNATSDFEPIAKAVLAQIGNANALPAKNIQIGGTMSRRTPIQIPLKNDGAMSFEMETLYTLKSIEGDIANFEVSYSALIGADVAAANIDVLLIGEGKMTYSISNQYSPESTSNFSMQMNIPIFGGMLKSLSKSHTKTITSYEAKQVNQ